MRIALIGDVGGHAEELRRALVALGADPETLDLPADLTVVQVGDLVHRGPDTPGVLSIVRDRIVRQPDQWIQLTGNHEALYLPGAPGFVWPEVLSDAAQDLLLGWWDSGAMRLACALDTDAGALLVTHAGLTAGLWNELDRPQSAADTAAIVNDLPQTSPSRAWRAGLMLGGKMNLSSGCVWAAAGHELYQSWHAASANGVPVPFGQVHGHSSAFFFGPDRWTGPPVLRSLFKIDTQLRHVKGVIGGRAFAGIDPGFGKVFRGTWGPLVLNGTVTGR